MQYELYIDVFFFVNLAMDFMLLSLLGRFLKLHPPRRRLAAASAAGALTACAAALFLLAPVPADKAEMMTGGGGSLARQVICACGALLGQGFRLALWCAVLAAMAAVMVRIAFRPGSAALLARETGMLLAEAVCAGGIMEAVFEHTAAGYRMASLLRGDWSEGMPLLIWGFGAAGAYWLSRFLWHGVFAVRSETGALRTVTLSAGGCSFAVTALLDTGNRLYEPESRRAVSIVSEDVWKKLVTAEMAVQRIPYRTVGNPWGLLEAVQIDSLQVEEPAKLAVKPWIARAPFAVSRDGSYEMLLHEDM